MNKIIRNIIYIFLGFLLISFVFDRFTPEAKTREVPLTEISQLVNQDKIGKISISENSLVAEIKDAPDTKLTARLGRSTEITEFLKNTGVEPEKLKNAQIEYKTPSGLSVFANAILPFLIPFSEV